MELFKIRPSIVNIHVLKHEIETKKYVNDQLVETKS
jgi:hypothetical protein